MTQQERNLRNLELVRIIQTGEAAKRKLAAKVGDVVVLRHEIADGAEAEIRLLAENEPLVLHVIRPWVARDQESKDDYLNFGRMTLVHAARLFDFTKKVRFSTYVVRSIVNMCSYLNRTFHNQRRPIHSLIASRSARMFYHDDVGHDEHLEKLKDRLVAVLPQVLDSKEFMVITLVFGMGGGRGKPTFSNVGKLIGVTKQQVCNIQRRALRKLRECFPEDCEVD